MLIDEVSGHPIEREYEGWIGHQIERYFKNLGFDVPVVAVSPDDEASWPADAWFTADGLVIGLQVKRPYVYGRNDIEVDENNDDFEAADVDEGHLWSTHDIYWNFELSGKDKNERLRQIKLISNSPEIYYCLPTFISRDYRTNSLNHCVFWRPDKDDSPLPQDGWYSQNPKRSRANARAAVENLGEKWRWGKLIEEIQNGKAARDSGAPGETIRKRLLKQYGERFRRDANQKETFCILRLPADIAPRLS